MSVQIGYMPSAPAVSVNQFTSMYSGITPTSNYDIQSSNAFNLVRQNTNINKNASISSNYVPTNFNIPQIGQVRQKTKVVRRTVDYHSSIVNWLHNRTFFKDSRKTRNLQPDVSYNTLNVPPSMLNDIPVNTLCTRAVRMAMNKVKCPIFTTKWTPEGRRLVTGASSGEFTLWHGITFSFETILQAHDIAVRAMIWSHSDQWMVTADHDGFVKYWQSNMNNVKMYQAHKEPVRGLSFSPLDQKLASCSDDGTVRVWDFYRCYEEKIMRGHGADVRCVDWHPHKGLIASGSRDNQQPVKLWDPRTGNSLATVHAHKNTVMDIKWNRNGNWMLTASRDHLIKLFDIRNLKEEIQCYRGHKKEATTISWHPIHENLFSSGGSDGSILFWLVGNDKEVGAIETAHDNMVWSMDWHPLGHILASGSNDHTTKFWTRNRPGDQMKDRYNLNTLPPGVSDEMDIEYDVSGHEDSKNVTDMEVSGATSIPGLDSFPEISNVSSVAISIHNAMLAAALKKKLVYTKPVSKEFEKAWFEGRQPSVVVSRGPILPNPDYSKMQAPFAEKTHPDFIQHNWAASKASQVEQMRQSELAQHAPNPQHQFPDHSNHPTGPNQMFPPERMPAPGYPLRLPSSTPRPFHEPASEAGAMQGLRSHQSAPQLHQMYVEDNGQANNSPQQHYEHEQHRPPIINSLPYPQPGFPFNSQVNLNRPQNVDTHEAMHGNMQMRGPQEFGPPMHNTMRPRFDEQHFRQNALYEEPDFGDKHHSDIFDDSMMMDQHAQTWQNQDMHAGPRSSHEEHHNPSFGHNLNYQPIDPLRPQYSDHLRAPNDYPRQTFNQVRPQLNDQMRPRFNEPSRPLLFNEPVLRPRFTQSARPQMTQGGHKPALLGHAPSDIQQNQATDSNDYYNWQHAPNEGPNTRDLHPPPNNRMEARMQMAANNEDRRMQEERNTNDYRQANDNFPNQPPVIRSLLNTQIEPTKSLKRKIEMNFGGRGGLQPLTFEAANFGVDRGRSRSRGKSRTHQSEHS